MFYAQLEVDSTEPKTTIFLEIDTASFTEAVTWCDAFCKGFDAGHSNFHLDTVSVTSSKPRGKTYFKTNDRDAIRRGLKI